ncbi:MAG: PHP domain-containing protein [bacterium]|nr:PHP domain-containing protein [bacterium]
MTRLAYDLHIHSCLSPCADDDMTPANIVGMASIKELDVIALTDHNSCKNCKALMEWSKQYGILALPGMELTTQEEVHVLCLFSSLESAVQFDSYVYSRLGMIKNDSEIFGNQFLYNEKDEKAGEEGRLLIQSTSIRFDEVYHLMQQYDGVMIPAHIDKNANSLLYNLGFIPEKSKFRCVEISNLQNKKQLCEEQEYLRAIRVISNSDAHYLTDINEPKNWMEVEEPTIDGVMDWLRNTRN